MMRYPTLAVYDGIVPDAPLGVTHSDLARVWTEFFLEFDETRTKVWLARSDSWHRSTEGDIILDRPRICESESELKASRLIPPVDLVVLKY